VGGCGGGGEGGMWRCVCDVDCVLCDTARSTRRTWQSLPVRGCHIRRSSRVAVTSGAPHACLSHQALLMRGCHVKRSSRVAATSSAPHAWLPHQALLTRGCHIKRSSRVAATSSAPHAWLSHHMARPATTPCGTILHHIASGAFTSSRNAQCALHRTLHTTIPPPFPPPPTLQRP
jgi:hypothetical protein